MELKVKAPLLSLATGEVVTLDDAKGARILAREGTVWITEEGSGEDHIVGPGTALVVGRPGRIVVQALQPARISIRAGLVAANDPDAGGERPRRDLLPPEDLAFEVRHRIFTRYY